MSKQFLIFYLVFVLGGLGLAAEDNLEVKGKIEANSLILPGGASFPATPVKGELFYRTDMDRFSTFDGQNWSGDNDKTVATKIVAASNSLDTNRAHYTCDGTADQVEIQAAIDALGANGGAVYLLEGTYNLSGPITFDDGASDTIDDSGKSLIGAGRGSRLNLTASGSNIISAASVQSLLISRLSLNGNNLGASRGLFFNGVSFSKIDKLWIEEMIVSGIWIDISSLNNTVSNCSIQSTGGSSGIFLQAGSNNNLLWNNQLAGNGSYGIGIWSSFGNTVLANTISGSSAEAGIRLQGSSNNTVSENNLRANGIGIRLQFGSSNNLLSRNLIQSSTNRGLWIYNGSNNNVVSKNIILNNSSWGIDIDGSTNNLILANLLRDNGSGGGAGGILISATFFGPPFPNFNLISSNRIFSSSFGYGIDIGNPSQGSEGNYLSGNLIDESGGYAITATSGPIRERGLYTNTQYTDKTKLTLEPVIDIDGNRTIESARPVSYVRVNLPGAWTVNNGKSAGDILILESITITGSAVFNDIGNLKLSAMHTLENRDTLALIWDGSFWVEIGYSDN